MGGSTVGAVPAGGVRTGATAAVRPPMPPGPEYLYDWWPAADDPALGQLAPQTDRLRLVAQASALLI